MNDQNDNTVFLKKEKTTSKPVEQKPQIKKEKTQEQKNLDIRKSLDR
jgi:hypothetical protein